MLSLKKRGKKAAPPGWGGWDRCWEAETIPFLQPPFTPDALKFVYSQKYLFRLKLHSEAVELNKPLKTFAFMIYEGS